MHDTGVDGHTARAMVADAGERGADSPHAKLWFRAARLSRSASSGTASKGGPAISQVTTGPGREARG
jgi:hypothetical protein